ncbi:MAG: GAF domain-containing protein [Acidobacteria bacterium]|nr:GAF domain-containing protein [Acidobacteriota bacterium]
MANLFGNIGDIGQLKDSLLLRLNRIYCTLAVGAALAISFELFLETGSADSLEIQRSRCFILFLVIFLLAGAFVCGLYIARQAKIFARKSEELLFEAKQRTTEIAALYDTSQDISGRHRLSSLLETIVGRAKTLLDASGCALFLFDKANKDFEIAVEIGVGIPVGSHIPLDEGLAGQVAKNMAPLIVNDYRRSPFRSKALQQYPISAAVCVPMIRDGELIGVLGVNECGNTKRKFADAEARLLSLFAHNAASAVFNARLMDALQNSKERFRIAAECASDIVYDWDLPTDSVKYFGAVTERAREKHSFLPETRKEYWDIVHPEDRDRVRRALEEHLKDGTPFSVEYRILDENGSHIIISDRATAIRNSRGVPVKLIGAVSNITERKQAEQMKSDFVSFVTHQLRTPLSGVKWMLELAADSTNSPEDLESFIRDARLSTDRLIGLVNDLLDLSRLERGKLQINPEDIEMDALTRGVIEEMHPLLSEKEQSLSCQVAAHFPVVSADAQLLRQVILNFTSNAMKYTPRGGEMKIRMHYDDAFVYWEIEDTGIGIPKSDQTMLFEKFYRAGNAIAVETEGTGLGLYLIRLIVERLGGSIGCESREGVGSTFKFSLPLHGNGGSNEQHPGSVN